MSLPTWAQVTPARRAHIERVVALLERWAAVMRVRAEERARWLRAGWLHDALRDAAFTDPLSHGPAAADRAARDGERDQSVLDAVRHHTVGSAQWDEAGRMLYLADFLEPGRPGDPTVRTDLARHVPTERDAELLEVARRRIEWVLRSGWPLVPDTVAFWNALVRQ
ncbi:MAG: HD domain-containing protein [Gemmatimonadales bacterium]